MLKSFTNLSLQIAAPKWGGRRYLLYAFTEQGVAMLSSVLRSKRAVPVNIAIMRAFVRLGELLATNKDLARKLMAPPAEPKRSIGFTLPAQDKPENRRYTQCPFHS